jgi:L-asparaginase II
MINRSPSDFEASPITVTVSRGPIVESCHQVIAAISDADGKLLRSWGDVEAAVYLRSAIKPIQALPLVETGAADAFNVTEQELSLACASHTGENLHVDSVTNWLKRIGLSIADLECGTHWPTYEKAALELAAAGFTPTAAHNNCSGKHSGFLTTALHLNEPTRGYIDLGHPVQRRIIKVLEDFTGLDLSKAPTGIDGCSIPTIAIPLDKAAAAIARFADPSKLATDRAAACRRIQNAISHYPKMIAGSDRLCTALDGAAHGKVIAKIGAEAVYLAALPELGLGIALKVIDGRDRAAEVALGALLEELGVMTDEMRRSTESYFHPILRNRNEIVVGHLEAVF